MIILKKTERITKVPIMLSPSQQRKNDILVDLLHRVYSSIIQSVSFRCKRGMLGRRRDNSKIC